VTKQAATTQALRKNAGYSVRSEDLGSFEQLFVDPVNSASIETNTNQLILGRRGTGKTLLLGAIHSRVNGRFPDSRCYAFYYSAVDFRSSAEYGGVVPTTKEKTHAFFHSFIEKLANDILELADKVFEKPNLLQALGLVGDAKKRQRELLEDRVLRLVDAARVGAESPLPSSVTGSRESHASSARDRHTSIGGALTSDGSRVGASFSRERSQRAESVEHVVLGSRRAFDPSLIRSFLVEIVDLLGLDYIIVLLDEWMSLAECQTEFAERIKQCLFGEERIAVKIAADQYQGQFNNAGTGHNFRGLEIGADIFPIVNLDQPFRDPVAGFALFADVLYRRLLFLNPDMQNFFGDPPVSNPSWFVEMIFDNEHAFEEASRGAQGICRDFHEIVQGCAKKIGWDVASGKVTFNTVRDVLVERTDATYDRVLRSVDSNPLLVNLIIPHVRDTGTRFFLVENRETRYAHIVDDLLSKRFIHALPLSEMHPTLKASHRLFEIDYGIYLDLMEAREWSERTKRDSEEPIDPSAMTSANSARFTVDIGPLAQVIGEEDRRRCTLCGVEFSASEKSFRTKRLCPNCFEGQPDE
jgi:hypothetical protein